MRDFTTLNLPKALVQSLARMNFTTPTEIQAQAIPLALEGKDILGSAQTGTGKTGAFGIPLIAKILSEPQSSALVLTPTRELALQVITTLEQMLGRNSFINTALLIGGDSMYKQLQQLKRKPRILVGTPGRINDHLERGSLNLDKTNFLVLDEMDRMLDIGFSVQLETILQYLPRVRQTLMFSATLPNNVVKLAEKYLQQPVRVAVGSTTTPIAKIKQELVHTSEADKYNKLVAQLNQREGSILVFVKTKWSAEKMAEKLRREQHSADAIHGDLRQSRRDAVIRAFRARKHRIMVATDIAARGLDIPHIEHVINYDLPQCPEDYIHRIGRTARAGAEGTAINLLTPQDGSKWKAIHRLINPGEKNTGPERSNSNNRRPVARKRRGSLGGGSDYHFAARGANRDRPRERDAR